MPPIWQALPFLLLAPAYTLAATFNCDGENDNGHTFIAKALAGPKQVHYREDLEATIRNTTYTIDICNPLKRNTTMDKKDQCHHGARVCAQAWTYPGGSIEEVIDIAGQYTHHGGDMEAKIKWMGTEDVSKEGFKVTLNGGRFPFDRSPSRPQRAVIEFICAKNLTGLEGFEDEKEGLERRDDDGEEGEKPEFDNLDEGKSLQFEAYHRGEEIDTLQLTWKTRYACANATVEDPAKPPASKSGGWGFFTWFVLIVFLLAAAYIIFGSWLNYNRYGARGWDLIPHGDTIRDLPYIIKELAGNLMSRIRGEGSRGGYSAV